jgi:hypothetical protein
MLLLQNREHTIKHVEDSHDLVEKISYLFITCFLETVHDLQQVLFNLTNNDIGVPRQDSNVDSGILVPSMMRLGPHSVLLKDLVLNVITNLVPSYVFLLPKLLKGFLLFRVPFLCIWIDW